MGRRGEEGGREDEQGWELKEVKASRVISVVDASYRFVVVAEGVSRVGGTRCTMTTKHLRPGFPSPPDQKRWRNASQSTTCNQGEGKGVEKDTWMDRLFHLCVFHHTTTLTWHNTIKLHTVEYSTSSYSKYSN